MSKTVYIVKFDVIGIPGQQPAFKGAVLAESDILESEIPALLEIGAIVAAQAESPAAVQTAASVEEKTESKPIQRMTKVELEDFANTLSLQIDPKKMKRDAMLAAIADAQAAQEEVLSEGPDANPEDDDGEDSDEGIGEAIVDEPVR